MSGLAFAITPGTMKANNLDDKDPIKSLRLESCNKKSEVLCREIKYSIQKLLMYPSTYTHNEVSGTLCTSSLSPTQSHTLLYFSVGLVLLRSLLQHTFSGE